MQEQEASSRTGRLPAPKLPAGLAHHLRAACALSVRDFAQLLQVDRSTASRFEQVGAPAWLLPAVAGLVVLHLGLGAAKVCAMLGLDPHGGTGRELAEHAFALAPLHRLVVQDIQYADAAGVSQTWP